MRLLIALLLIVFPAAAQAKPLQVVASFSIIADMAQHVAGDAANVTSLVGPDSDAHAYEPSPSDIKRLADADMVLINGLAFESWLGRLIVASGYTGPIVTVSKDVTPLMMPDGLVQDPHAWQDVANAKLYVAAIRDALTKADSANAEIYKANAARYLQELDALDAWVKTQIAELPVEKRKLISSHNAFQYYARAYSVTFISPAASTAGQTSAADIAQLIDQIRKQHVRALFLENISDPRLMMQLTQDTGAVIGGTLYSDALSAPTGPAPYYVAMIRQNTGLLIAGMMQNQ